jgi:dihydropteroate synthase
MVFRARQFEFKFPQPTIVMGVVNVTPDSFSDGGQYLDVEAAVEHGIQLVQQGAGVIDVGGESTRPRATPVPEAEELRRIVPVIERLADKVAVPISVDTMKPRVAAAALEAGASIVNDIAANRTDPEMWHVAAKFRAGYIAMHMQGTPETMQQNPAYVDVVDEVNLFFGDRLEKLAAAGVPVEHVALDVGIGFGKRLDHNLHLLRALGHFTTWRRPLLVGVSRKSFIGQLLGAKVNERMPASLAGACWAVQSGAQMIRTHDVAETVQAIRMTEALLVANRGNGPDEH